MSGNPRDRSRSPRGGKGDGRDGKPEAKAGGSSESDIVNVAIKQLTPKIRERLEKLFDEGLLKENDLDLRSITVFASLNEGLQDRVMTHMENERIYVANARSKSGFLIATCDKAKTGCLDARGLGAIDPWRSALVAMATPKQKLIELEPERDWLDKKGTEPVKFHVNVAAAPEVGQPRVTVEVPLTETAEALKSKLADMGVKSIQVNKMKLHAESVGFLKDRYTLAYYNLVDGTELELQNRVRGGSVLRKDHAVPLKRPKTHERQAAAAAAAAAAASKPGAALPGLPLLPGLSTGAVPGLPGLPKLPSVPGLQAAGAALPGLAAPKLPGGLPTALAGLVGGTAPAGVAGATAPAGLTPPAGLLGAGLPKLPGMPGMPTLPGMPTNGGIPAGLAAPKMPGAPAVGGMPGGPAGPPAGLMGGMPPAGGGGAPPGLMGAMGATAKGAPCAAPGTMKAGFPTMGY